MRTIKINVTIPLEVPLEMGEDGSYKNPMQLVAPYIDDFVQRMQMIRNGMYREEEMTPSGEEWDPDGMILKHLWNPEGEEALQRRVEAIREETALAQEKKDESQEQVEPLVRGGGERGEDESPFLQGDHEGLRDGRERMGGHPGGGDLHDPDPGEGEG